jgi:hypothetical protein
MLDALDESIATGAKFGSLHTAYSASGANELTGGTPAYARKAATWAAAASRAKATSGAIVFDVPASSTVRWVGFWDAVTAGTFLGMTPNGGGLFVGFAVPDVSNDVLEAPAHGFSDGQTVVVWVVPGGTLPAPLAEGTVYFVVSSTTDDLKLALTAGGAAVNLTTVGAGFLQRITEEQYGTQGTLSITTATLRLG